MEEKPWQWKMFIDVEQESEAVSLHFLRIYSKIHEAEAMEKWFPMTYSFCLTQSTSLYLPGLPTQGWNLLQWTGHINYMFRKYCTVSHTSQSYRDTFFIAPSSQINLGCVKLTKENKTKVNQDN